jgi:hypothetical protein
MLWFLPVLNARFPESGFIRAFLGYLHDNFMAEIAMKIKMQPKKGV